MDINQRPKNNYLLSNSASPRTMNSDLNRRNSLKRPQEKIVSSNQTTSAVSTNNQNQSSEGLPFSANPPIPAEVSRKHTADPTASTTDPEDTGFSQHAFPPQKERLTKSESAFFSNQEEQQSGGFKLPNDSRLPLKKLFTFGLLILVIGLFSLGIYYFLLRNADSENTETIERKNTIMEKTDQAPVQVTSGYYSTEQPNYLSIDIETITIEKLGVLFLEASEKIPTSQVESLPAEFIVTDKNNNPIAFSRFTLVSGLSLPPEVLENLEDKFSLFMLRQPQSDRPRMGIAIELKNREALISSVRLEESALIKSLDPLFLKTTPTSLVGEFNDGVYQGIPVRYLNLNQQEDLSIDYTVSSSNLLIGTSKEVLRSIIDLNR